MFTILLTETFQNKDVVQTSIIRYLFGLFKFRINKKFK